MKKLKKTEIIAIIIIGALLIYGCIIGRFSGGLFIGAGIILLIEFFDKKIKK